MGQSSSANAIVTTAAVPTANASQDTAPVATDATAAAAPPEVDAQGGVVKLAAFDGTAVKLVSLRDEQKAAVAGVSGSEVKKWADKTALVMTRVNVDALSSAEVDMAGEPMCVCDALDDEALSPQLQRTWFEMEPAARPAWLQFEARVFEFDTPSSRETALQLARWTHRADEADDASTYAFPAELFFGLLPASQYEGNLDVLYHANKGKNLIR
jgi:hypothetical protein